MSGNKITWVHVSLIGAVIMLIVGFAMYFLMIKPINEANAQAQTKINSTETQSYQIDGASFNISQIPQAKTKLEAAKVRKAEKAAELASTLRSKSLPKSEELYIGKDQGELLGRTLPRWLLLPKVVVQTMEGYSQKLAKRYGIKAQTDFAVKAPATDPKLIPSDIVAWNLGPMTVSGDFQKVMQWCQAWNTAPLLCSVNDLKMSLADRKGKVTATCSLVAYLFPTGPGASANAGGGGAPGGGGGGMGGPGGNGPGSFGPPGGPGGGAGGNMPGGGGNGAGPFAPK